MARLLADENFPQPAVVVLRTYGHDVLTLLEAGLAGRAVPDNEVLAFAASQARILLTLNRKDFIHLHAVSSEHAGIVACTFDLDSTALAARIHSAITNTDTASQLIRVNRHA